MKNEILAKKKMYKKQINQNNYPFHGVKSK